MSKDDPIQVGLTLGFTIDNAGNRSVTVTTDPNIPGDDEKGLEAFIKAGKELQVGSSPTHQPAATTGKRLEDALAEYFAEKSIKYRTDSSYKPRADALLKFFGPDIDVFSIDQTRFSEFCLDLAANESREPVTTGNYITVACSMLNFHRHRTGVPILTTKTLKPKVKTVPREARAAFTMEQLKVIFDNAAAYRHSHPEAFWVTVLSAFSGCRVEEICQVNLRTDLKQSSKGAWYLEVNESGGEKSVKNLAGHRVIPLHSALVRHGIVTFFTETAARQLRPFEALWPPHRSSKTNEPIWNHKIVKWGGDELDSLETRGFLKKGKLSYFHSHRHTIATHLERRGVSDAHRSAMQGQSSGGINSTVYSKVRSDPDFLLSLVEEHLGEYEALLDRAIIDTQTPCAPPRPIRKNRVAARARRT
jgi:integrase